MALLEGVDGRITQNWGVPNPGVTSLEPAMWASGDKAYWQPYAGGAYHTHFHPGVDIANVEGTPIHAMESGIVSFANLYDYISGIRVEVEIRPGTKFSFNHLSRLAVAKGDHVARGQVIGYVGSTGATTGPHAHQAVSHLEVDAFGVGRTFLYNPSLFIPGGRLADVAWIQPVAPPPPPPSPTTGYKADGDPAPMRFRSLVNQSDGAVALLKIKPGKPYRTGATIGSKVAKTAPASGEFIVAVGRIQVADLPAGERTYGDVFIVPSYLANGDHFFYVKAVDVTAR